jgi:hypothetical protein
MQELFYDDETGACFKPARVSSKHGCYGMHLSLKKMKACERKGWQQSSAPSAVHMDSMVRMEAGAAYMRPLQEQNKPLGEQIPPLTGQPRISPS